MQVVEGPASVFPADAPWLVEQLPPVPLAGAVALPPVQRCSPSSQIGASKNCGTPQRTGAAGRHTLLVALVHHVEAHPFFIILRQVHHGGLYSKGEELGHRPESFLEGVEAEGGERTPLWLMKHSQRGPGDEAEDPFGAYEEVVLGWAPRSTWAQSGW